MRHHESHKPDDPRNRDGGTRQGRDRQVDPPLEAFHVRAEVLGVLFTERKEVEAARARTQHTKRDQRVYAEDGHGRPRSHSEAAQEPEHGAAQLGRGREDDDGAHE